MCLLPHVTFQFSRPPPITASVVGAKEELSYAPGVPVSPGQTVSVSIQKRGVDNSVPGISALFGGCGPASSSQGSQPFDDELAGDLSSSSRAFYAPQAACRYIMSKLI